MYVVQGGDPLLQMNLRLYYPRSKTFLDKRDKNSWESDHIIGSAEDKQQHSHQDINNVETKVVPYDYFFTEHNYGTVAVILH